MKRFWDKVDVKENNECWNWKAVKSGNYGMFWYKNKMVLSHRMAYALEHNNLSIINHNKNYHKNNNNFECVLHHCDNPLCCNPNHMYIGNNKDNINDKVTRKRSQKMIGSLNGHSKITEQDVINIRKEYIPRKNGGLKTIAEKYGISVTNIHDIIKRKIWSHI